MAEFKPKLTLKWELTVTLSEDEAQALDAIVGYGAREFLEVFYKHMGRAYLEPFEAGFHSLAKAIGQQLGPQLYELKTQRKAIADGLARARAERADADKKLAARVAEMNAETAKAVPGG